MAPVSSDIDLSWVLFIFCHWFSNPETLFIGQVGCGHSWEVCRELLAGYTSRERERVVPTLTSSLLSSTGSCYHFLIQTWNNLGSSPGRDSAHDLRWHFPSPQRNQEETWRQSWRMSNWQRHPKTTPDDLEAAPPTLWNFSRGPQHSSWSKVDWPTWRCGKDSSTVYICSQRFHDSCSTLPSGRVDVIWEIQDRD